VTHAGQHFNHLKPLASGKAKSAEAVTFAKNQLLDK
jgi:hypothetical protein|tara:strand:+ start:712 stop:819 length:108 start_codon:yes stop_codon:yes gene_type:complete